jgi:phage protein D
MLESFLASKVSKGPRCKVIANGTDITVLFQRTIVSIECAQSVDENSDGLTLTLQDVAKEIPIPKRGARLEVWLGYGEKLQNVGSYVVDQVDISNPPNQIRITGTSTPFTADAFGGQPSMITRRSQSYDGKTLGEIVATIAKRNNLTPVVQEELAGVVFEHIDQVDESDTNFLLRIARDVGGILTPMDSKLVLVDERGGKTATGKPLDAVQLEESQVTSWRVSLGTKLNEAKKCEAKYHDYNECETKVAASDIPKNEIWKASGED